MLAEEFVRFPPAAVPWPKLIFPGYCLQHQVARQPSLRPVRHYLNPAEAQALLQGPPERPGRLLR